MKKLLASAACLAMAACATVEPAPVARPLSQASIDAMGPTPVSVTGSELGVTKAWYFTEVNGGGAGLVGAIAGAIATAIINAGPSARAQKQADEVARVQPVDALNGSMLEALKVEAANPGSGGVTFEGPTMVYKTATPGLLNDTVEITTFYTLSEDSSVLRIVAVASYSNQAMPYKTPYTFKKSVPKSETMGPLYRNTFTYYSKPLPIPTLTPEVRERLIANIEDSARDASGALPAEGTPQYKSMQREIELAKDNKLTATEISVFLTREWLSNDGAMIKEEVRRANAFVSHYALLDLNRTVVPSMEGEDELLETSPDQRTVRRIGKGVDAGSYVSSASDVNQYATYGNTWAVAKSTTAFIKSLKPAKTKPARKPAKKTS